MAETAAGMAGQTRDMRAPPIAVQNAKEGRLSAVRKRTRMTAEDKTLTTGQRTGMIHVTAMKSQASIGLTGTGKRGLPSAIGMKWSRNQSAGGMVLRGQKMTVPMTGHRAAAAEMTLLTEENEGLKTVQNVAGMNLIGQKMPGQTALEWKSQTSVSLTVTGKILRGHEMSSHIAGKKILLTEMKSLDAEGMILAGQRMAIQMRGPAAVAASKTQSQKNESLVIT